MKAATAALAVLEQYPPGECARRAELNASHVVEQGARFVPQTLRYLGDFAGRSSLRTWLHGICVNVAHEYRRRGRKRACEALEEGLPEIVAAASQETELERAEWRRSLSALLDELDESQRVVFVLYEIEELKMREIADALSCPLRTAYSRCKSAKARVIEAFRRLRAKEVA